MGLLGVVVFCRVVSFALGLIFSWEVCLFDADRFVFIYCLLLLIGWCLLLLLLCCECGCLWLICF